MERQHDLKDLVQPDLTRVCNMLMHNSPTYAIHQQAVEAIARNPHLRQRQVSLKTHGNAVTLCGLVQSFFEKQMAQESLRDIPGINRIENRLEVRWTNSML